MDVLKVKLAVSLVILIVGCALTVLFLPSGGSSGDTCLLLDFGGYEVDQADVEGFEDATPLEVMELICSVTPHTCEVSGDEVVSVDGRANSDTARWGLYSVPSGGTGWIEVSSGEKVSSSDSTVLCWSYCGEGSSPTVAVDATGKCFYTYESPQRVVSLAPSCTETIVAVGGERMIVGTDFYSNYPDSIVESRDAGYIAVTGGFSNPSFEAILKQSPDLVVCIGSQGTHLQMAEKLRNTGIDVVVTSGGEDIRSVMDNTYMVGVALGLGDKAKETIDRSMEQIYTVEGLLLDDLQTRDKHVMVALSAVKSPWVAGSETYINDVIGITQSSNIYAGEYGWVQVNSETIAKLDPGLIIIVSGDYAATEEDYQRMLSSMSSEWTGTTAFQKGEIWLFTGQAADLASRPGPRIPQITEILSRAVQSESFHDGIVMPKYIDTYKEYLHYTEEGAI